MHQSSNSIRILKSLPLVKSWEARMSMLNPIGMFYKRCFDIVFSLVACVAIALFIPIIALIIKLQSRGPIFFVQDRTGKYGRTFRCLKFRTMRTNGECNIRQCTKHDPRVFPFGRFLRRTNLDELPQFFNVLMGDMSIVGPRPHMLYHTDYYSKLIPHYMNRHFVRPGSTGWAQVTGFRGETRELWQMEGRVRCDMWYINHWSLWLDLRIMVMTVKTIFVRDEMAY